MNKKIIFMGIGILVLGALLAGFVMVSEKGEPKPQANVPQIPEGNWTTVAQNNISFQYPQKLMATYISAVDWPPQVNVSSELFSCEDAGDETMRAGSTKRELINGRVYCVTRVSEGAAGSIYTQYAYAFEIEGRVIILTFSLRFVQCANYDEPNKTNCEDERSTFDIGGVIDRIAESMKFI